MTHLFTIWNLNAVIFNPVTTKINNMKTAMQEHFEWLQENQLYFGIPIEAIDNAEDLLEKEKEQIKKAFEFGVADAYNFIEDEAEQYYKETYEKK